ncbi:kinase-like protein [Wilcoxina mikolae CBS 423.85]|nr:kinase-like protein [Wilcoxina mikolae CBS 423.85]
MHQEEYSLEQFTRREMSDPSNQPTVVLRSYRTVYDHLYQILLPGGYGGTGSYSKVSKAMAPTGEHVAIKEIRADEVPGGEKHILNEIQILGRCSHHNVLSLLEAFTTEDEPRVYRLVACPWAPVTLSHLIWERTDKGRRVHCEWFLRNDVATEIVIHKIFMDISNGLAYLHGIPVKHKDIKPCNILLQQEKTERGTWLITPIIADFGISKVRGRGRSHKIHQQHLLAPRPGASSEIGEQSKIGCFLAWLHICTRYGRILPKNRACAAALGHCCQ